MRVCSCQLAKGNLTLRCKSVASPTRDSVSVSALLASKPHIYHCTAQTSPQSVSTTDCSASRMAAAKREILSMIEVFGLGTQVTSIACLRPELDTSPAIAIAGTLDGAARLLTMPSVADVDVARGIPGAKREADGPPTAMRSAVTIAADMALPGAPVRIGGVSSGPVRADGTMTALTASNDAIVRLWHLGDFDSARSQAAAARKADPSDPDIPVGELLHELNGHKFGCQAVTCLSTDRIVSGGFGGMLVQWDTETGAPVQVLDAGAPIIAVSEIARPESRTAPVASAAAGTSGSDAGSRLVAVALAEGPVTLFDVRGGGANARVASLGGHSGHQCNTVTDMGAGIVVSGGCDGTMRVWDCRRLDAVLSSHRVALKPPTSTGSSGGGMMAEASAAAGRTGGGSGSMEAAMARARGARGVGRPGDALPAKASEAPATATETALVAEASFDEEWVYGVSGWAAGESGATTLWSASADGTARAWDLNVCAPSAGAEASAPDGISGAAGAGAQPLTERQRWGKQGGPSWICIGAMSDSTALASLTGGRVCMLFA